jgi:GTP-binding protein
MSIEKLPLVAVVGRPNVGKSTLVNRIVGARTTIVEEKPGVTRDRKELTADWIGREFRIVDTGGWLDPATLSKIDIEESLAVKVSAQAEKAMQMADVVMLLVDATVGIMEEDEQVARLLLRAKNPKPVLLVVNKVDDAKRENDIWEFQRLGLGIPYAVSAIHGRGSGDLLDALIKTFPPEPGDDDTDDEDDDPNKPFAVAIVGRPNVGKSTLFNRLVGDERAVVHDLPGTTRDTIDTLVETEDGLLKFIDTAGLRRRAKIDDGTEYFSMVRALQAIDTADAALLVVDADEGVTHQDQRLAERVDAAGTAIVVVLNKWDLVGTERRVEVQRDVADRLGFLGYAPVLKISALSGKGAHRLLPALKAAEEAYHSRVPTSKLNALMREAQAAHPAPTVGKHRARIMYATQGATDPPTFTLFTNRTLPPTYLRYIERKIRETFDLGPTPIKIRVRRRSEDR